MPSVGNVLLVGSVPLADSEAVFTALATELGTIAPRYPDGETGERLNWIRWQHHVFRSASISATATPATGT